MTDTGTGLLFGGLSRATSVPSSSRSRPTTKWQRHSLKCCARRSQLSAYLGGCFQCGGAFQKDKIKEQKPNELARVDSPDLRVWKLRNPQKSKEIMRTEYLANLRRLDDVPGNKATTRSRGGSARPIKSRCTCRSFRGIEFLF